MKALWQHVNYTSIFASYFQYLFGSLNMGNLFTLGLLHDIGKFIMIRLAPLAANDADLPGGYSPLWTPEEEEERYGISHPLVGRLALEHWGLSNLLVETVALHHAPVHIPPHELGLDREALQYLLVLFLADQAAHLFADGEAAEDQLDRLHPAYHALIDRNRLLHLIQDKVLLSQLREAEAIAGVYA
jgi:HD-like signal output (HDOD) protein